MSFFGFYTSLTELYTYGDVMTSIKFYLPQSSKGLGLQAKAYSLTSDFERKNDPSPILRTGLAN
jgi:hypothetical protein